MYFHLEGAEHKTGEPSKYVQAGLDAGAVGEYAPKPEGSKEAEQAALDALRSNGAKPVDQKQIAIARHIEPLYVKYRIGGLEVAVDRERNVVMIGGTCLTFEDLHHIYRSTQA